MVNALEIESISSIIRINYLSNNLRLCICNLIYVSSININLVLSSLIVLIYIYYYINILHDN